ncbi:MAG: tRNA pseudouridine(38-40) synthase TruA [Anaerolineae bacterium]|nr:tRNA pseudouridine(38-40) synthase TruA [Anaerolineae bacterium]
MQPGIHLRATVAYDGTDFCGFQVQAAQRTVQGALEEALAQITQQETRVTGAGRTDSGVHALGQVIAFRTAWAGTIAELHRAWNAVLPRDVAVWSLTEAEAGFHPRFDARSRAYRYTIWNHGVRNPLLRRTALWEPTPLDLAAMQEAAQALVGEHDFGTFGSPPQGTNTVRRVLSADWTRDGARLSLDIEANAYLYRMVRSIVGTLLLVGRGTLSVAGFAALCAARERAQSGPSAPAHGLCLMAVHY